MRNCASLLLLAALLSGACRDWDQFDPAVGGGGVGAAGAGGMSTSSSSGGGGPGGGGAGGGELDVPCNAVDALSDDFDAPLDYRWAESNGASSINVAGGNLVLSFDSSDQYGELFSAAYDSRGRTFGLELAEDVPADFGFWMSFAGDGDNYVELYVDGGGTLYTGVEKEGSWETVTSAPFDIALHRHWRFRNDEGDSVVHLEVSPDGAAWSVLWSRDVSDLMDLQYARIFIGAHSDTIAAPAQISVAAVRGLTSSAPVCASASLSDDFDDDFRSRAWGSGWQDDGCYSSEASGVVHFGCDAGVDAGAAWGSSALYDLSESHISVEVDDYPLAGAEGWMFLLFVLPQSNTLVEMEIEDGNLELYSADDGNFIKVAELPYDPSAHRFLRLRGAAGQLFYEVSPDASTWSTVTQIPAPFDLSHGRLVIGAGNSNPNSSSDVHFDNFNRGP